MKLRHQYRRQQVKMIFLSKRKQACGIHPIKDGVSRMFFIIVLLLPDVLKKAFDVSVKNMVYLKQKRLMFLSETSNVFRQIFSMIPDKPEGIEQIRQKLYPTPSPSTLLNWTRSAA